MSKYCLSILLLFAVVMTGGCDNPSERDVKADNAAFIEGITLSDLKPTTPEDLEQEAYLTFQILTFVLEPDSIDRLKEVCDGLSHKNIRFTDKEAFGAGGIQIGAGPYQKGVEALRDLQQIGAVYKAQMNATIEQNATEPITHVPINEQQTVLYSTSETGLGTVDLEGGFLGWIITSHADMKEPGTVQVKLEPAHWQVGLEDLRFRINKDPYDYYTFSHARIVARMSTGDVMILAPNRPVPAQETLDKYLFYVPGRHEKVKVFVIVCQNPGIS